MSKAAGERADGTPQSSEQPDAALPVSTSDGKSATPGADALLANARPERLPYRDRKNEHKLQRRLDEHALRKTVAKWSYIALAAQIAVADGVFVAYAWVGRDWDVPVAAISVWLGATVVQVIAVLLVITRYLFPPDRKKL